MKHIVMYTDGSSPENAKGSGRGGYCAILTFNGNERVVSGHLENTTNNQAELSAILAGLSVLKEPCEVTVVTDSQFCIGTLSLGWKRKDKECAWISQGIDKLMKVHRVTFQHVDGHTGHPYNEKCDQIARQKSGV